MLASLALTFVLACQTAQATSMKNAIHRSLGADTSIIEAGPQISDNCMRQMIPMFNSIDPKMLMDGPLIEFAGNQTTLMPRLNETHAGDFDPDFVSYLDSYFENEDVESYVQSGKCEVSPSDKCLVCDLMNDLFGLAPFCSAIGGVPRALNANITCNGFHIIQLDNLPLCTGPSCDESLVNFLEYWVNDMDNMDNCIVSLVPSDAVDKCLDSSNNKKFTVPTYNSTVTKRKTCNWLKRRSPGNRRTLCTSNEIREACPLTCCTCEDEARLQFPRRKKDNLGQYVTTLNSCEWLGRQTGKRRNRLCSMRKRDIDGMEPAWKQCPSTCGFCSGRE